jgi:hypothetical protein
MESGKVDRNKVSIATEVEELYWTARLGATREAIETAVQKAGTNPEAAAEWLRVNHLCHERPPSPVKPSVPRSR